MRPQLALLVLTILATSGCGHMRLQGGDVESVEEWPLAQRIDVGVLPDGSLKFSSSPDKPSALVRITLDAVEEALALGLEPALSLKFYGAPFHSGLFSTVAYQYGTDFYGVDADCTLDMTLIQGERDFRWYSYVGAITLSALPVVFYEPWTVTCTVRDKEHKVLAELERTDTITDVLWLPFLAFNILFNVVDLGGLGTSSGLNSNGVNAKVKATQERMFRSIMVEVRDLIASPPPEGGETPPEDSSETPENSGD